MTTSFARWVRCEVHTVDGLKWEDFDQLARVLDAFGLHYEVPDTRHEPVRVHMPTWLADQVASDPWWTSTEEADGLQWVLTAAWY